MSRMLYFAVACLPALTAGCAQNTAPADKVSSRVDDLVDRVRLLELAQVMSRVRCPDAGTPETLPSEWYTIDSTRFRDEASLEAITGWMSIILDNMANAKTAGFKRSQPAFDDNSQGSVLRLTGTHREMSAGPCILTNRRLDVYINGDGFFQVRTQYNGQGIIAYTRAGDFVRNQDGDLVLSNSEVPILEPALNIATTVDEDSITIAGNGTVTVRQQGSTELAQIGKIQLARFPHPENLLAIGPSLYVETDASGEPILGSPGEDGLGFVFTGSLEGSNVNLDRERVELAFARRALDINSQYAQGLAYKAALNSSASAKP